MPNVRKILRRIGISLCVLLLLPLVVADRPASVCESVDIPNTTWVVEHRVSRTCAYFYCDDYIIAVDRSGKKQSVMLLQFLSNNYGATVDYDKNGSYIYINYGHFGHYTVKRSEFDGIPIRYKELDPLFYEDNKKMINAGIELDALDNRLPPLIDGLRIFFTPDFLRKDEIEYRNKLEKIKLYTSNPKHYAEEEFKPPLNFIGINTNCYNFP